MGRRHPDQPLPISDSSLWPNGLQSRNSMQAQLGYSKLKICCVPLQSPSNGMGLFFPASSPHRRWSALRQAMQDSLLHLPPTSRVSTVRRHRQACWNSGSARAGWQKAGRLFATTSSPPKWLRPPPRQVRAGRHRRQRSTQGAALQS